MATITRTTTATTYRLSIRQVERMVRAGLLSGKEPVVLLDGLLVTKLTQSTRHVTATGKAYKAIEAVLPLGWHLRKEDPIALPSGPEEADSLPEPDLAVVRGDLGAYSKRHPSGEDAGLLVEVSDSTLHEDRIMLKRYAWANVPASWLIDLNAGDVKQNLSAFLGTIEVHTDPTGPAKRPRYRKVERFEGKDRVPVVLAGVEVGRVLVGQDMP
jgi:hypothetical protein